MRNESGQRTSNRAAVAVSLMAMAIVLGLKMCGEPAHSSAASPMTFTVVNNGDMGPGSLRQAIIDANLNPGSDTINFDAAVTGTITLTSGELFVSDDVMINGPGANVLTVSGNNMVRVFNVANPAINVTLSGLTIANGKNRGSDGDPGGDGLGGGIYNASMLNIIKCTLSGNSAIGGNSSNSHGGNGSGGGIYNASTGTLNVASSTLSGNSASGGTGAGGGSFGAPGSGSGGGIFNDSAGTVKVTNSKLSGNSAGSSSSGLSDGGGITNSGTATITNSSLSSNSATNQGGGIFNTGTLTITNSTLSSNSAKGGGIYNVSISNILTIINSTLSGNSGDQGGGIFLINSTANISNTTLSANSASDQGGGIIVTGAAATMNIKNSIVANSTGGDCSISGATFNGTGKNFTTDGTCPGFTQVPSTGPGGLNLGPLQVNSPGSTATHALLLGSVAIDAVTDCTDLSVPTPAAVTTDQRGVMRPIDGDGNGTAECDVGAYEFLPCTITCPANQTANTGPGATDCCTPVTYPDPTVASSCGTVACIPPSGSCFPVGTTTVTCATVQDGPSCTFTVTVNDTTPPVITCPMNQTLSANANCQAVTTYSATATDNCTASPTVTCTPPSGSTFPQGPTTVTCTATDGAGNTAMCTFTVTVNDSTPPVITCPQNQTLSANANCQAVATYTATATDNCTASPTVTCAPPSGSTFNLGTTTVSCKATDGAGLMATCTFTVTVQDNTPPTILCPANVTKPNDSNQCGAMVTFTPTVSDNCPGAAFNCTPSSGSFFPTGTTTVTCTAKDAVNKMSSCMFTVTVNDTQAPAIMCPGNITTAAPASCPLAGSTPVSFVTPGTANGQVTDNCPLPPNYMAVCTPASGTSFPVGTTTVTCTATDTSGNTAMCTFAVTVFSFCLQDETNPGNVVLVDVVSGAYRYCCNGALVATGTGTLTVKGCIATINDTKGDRKVQIQVDTSVNKGTAFIQRGQNQKCFIEDKDLTNNTCLCP